MQCDFCNTKMLEFNLIFSKYYYCSNCDKSIYVKNDLCCSFPNLQYRKRITSNGNFQLLKQCLSCGFIQGKIYKFKNDNNINIYEIPLIDDSILKASHIKEKDLYFNMLKTIYDNKKNSFFAKLNLYYNSDLWKRKRKYVLIRDKYLCQACLNKKATEVHHLTYRHVFDEPLFELVSICKDCHTKITLLDRGLYNY